MFDIYIFKHRQRPGRSLCATCGNIRLLGGSGRRGGGSLPYFIIISLSVCLLIADNHAAVFPNITTRTRIVPLILSFDRDKRNGPSRLTGTSPRIGGVFSLLAPPSRLSLV